MNKKNIAIIGAGVAGLSLAHKLLKKGMQVTLYDGGKEVGGQLYAFPLQGSCTEIYYHHTFKSDVNFINLCEELNIESHLKWYDSSMAYYVDGIQYAFGTPIDLLKFKPLSYFNKVKFVLSILQLQSYDNINFVKQYTAKEWFFKKGYGKVWEIIWAPLFRLKFADLADEISLVWLWDKLIKRGKSRSGTKEKLCYMDGSFFRLAEALKKSILDKGGNIRLNTAVKSISKEEDSFSIHVGDNTVEKHDIVVSTLSAKNTVSIVQPMKIFKEIENYKYQAAICAIFVLDKPFSEFYWTNVGDYELPFGGVIEHTNFVGVDKYDGKSIVYISRYLSKESAFFKLDRQQILDSFVEGLKTMKPSFDSDQIIERYLFKQEDAQPIVTKSYTPPSMETSVDGMYWISTHHVYPHDRGIEYAIEQAELLSQKLN